MSEHCNPSFAGRKSFSVHGPFARFSMVVLCLSWASSVLFGGPQSTLPIPAGAVDDWASYGHDPGGMRFSPLTQIRKQTRAPYGMFRRPLLSPGAHLPCSPPPWGNLIAVDMIEGKIRWQTPLGNFTLDRPAGPPGSISFGGPIVTGGGLVFIAGTLDPNLRAFEVQTGQEVWKGRLPAPGHATPMTYQLSPQAKQYMVIAAGGHAKITEEAQSDAVVAFTLP